VGWWPTERFSPRVACRVPCRGRDVSNLMRPSRPRVSAFPYPPSESNPSSQRKKPRRAARTRFTSSVSITLMVKGNLRVGIAQPDSGPRRLTYSAIIGSSNDLGLAAPTSHRKPFAEGNFFFRRSKKFTAPCRRRGLPISSGIFFLIPPREV